VAAKIASILVASRDAQIVPAIVKLVTVFVVNIELTDVYWYEPTLLTFCAFMSSVWIDAVVIGSLPYCATAVPTRERILFIS